MKTLGTTRSSIENSDPRFDRPAVDYNLLRSTLLEAISLHTDAKVNSRGHLLTELSDRLGDPRWPSPLPIKAKALVITRHINAIIDEIERT